MKLQNRDASNTVEIEPGLQAIRATLNASPGYGFALSAITGTMAASLAANSTIFTLRNGFAMGGKGGLQASALHIQRIRCKYTTIVAAAALTLERLALYKGGGASATGGTTLIPVAKRSLSRLSSAASLTTSGDARISTTATLTVTNTTFDADPSRSRALTSKSNVAGAFDDWIWEFGQDDTQELSLLPGQLIAIRNPVVFPATQTWQMQVDVDWRESPIDPIYAAP